MHWGGAGGNLGLVPDPPSLPPKDLRSGGGGRQGARPPPIWRCGLLSIRTHARLYRAGALVGRWKCEPLAGEKLRRPRAQGRSDVPKA